MTTITLDTEMLTRTGAVRNNFVQEGEALVKLLKIPYFGTAMSKGGVSEGIEGRFGGIYGGGASTKEVKDAVESAALALFLGHYPVCFVLSQKTTRC